MKNLRVAAGVLLAALGLAGTASAQVRSVVSASKQPASKAPTSSENSTRTNGTRARVLGQPVKGTQAGGNATPEKPVKQPEKSNSNHSANTAPNRTLVVTSNHITPNAAANRARVVSIEPAKPAESNSSKVAPKANSTPAATAPAVPSQIYRIGVRDVLDIQLPGQSGKQSTLFTVVDGGLVEYPLAGGPILAAGLTTQEVADILRQRIKILENPNVAVSVRDYASHGVSVSGLVAAPGVKNLRREAVPLYTLLAEALMLPEAARATIARQGQAPMFIDLKDASQAATLVLPGDIVKVSGEPSGPTEFFFIGGEINSPGQKPFHTGFTLTQAIIASGGVTKSAGSKVRISRQAPDGRLVSQDYNFKKIQDGKDPDPVLQKGDRIIVNESR